MSKDVKPSPTETTVDSDVRLILAKAEKFAAERKAAGWTQADFAAGLKRFFEERPSKPSAPMSVFIASIGQTSFVLTATDVADARRHLTTIRGSVKGMKFRQIDQSVRQVWGLFPIKDVSVDGTNTSVDHVASIPEDADAA